MKTWTNPTVEELEVSMTAANPWAWWAEFDGDGEWEWGEAPFGNPNVGSGDGNGEGGSGEGGSEGGDETQSGAKS